MLDPVHVCADRGLYRQVARAKRAHQGRIQPVVTDLLAAYAKRGKLRIPWVRHAPLVWLDRIKCMIR